MKKLLGVNINYNLKFNKHLDSKSKSKCSFENIALRKFCKKKHINELVFTSQFSYCPLVWMFHSRTMSDKITHLHERCLHIVYGDITSTCEKLLETDRSLSIKIRNLQILATEILKVKVWLLSFSVISFQNEVFSITCVKLSSLFQT